MRIIIDIDEQTSDAVVQIDNEPPRLWSVTNWTMTRDIMPICIMGRDAALFHRPGSDQLSFELVGSYPYNPPEPEEQELRKEVYDGLESS